MWPKEIKKTNDEESELEEMNDEELEKLCSKCRSILERRDAKRKADLINNFQNALENLLDNGVIIYAGDKEGFNSIEITNFDNFSIY